MDKNFKSPVSAETAHLINCLQTNLKKEFGCDFAYTIMGKGHIVAASNMKDGVIKPVTSSATVTEGEGGR